MGSENVWEQSGTDQIIEGGLQVEGKTGRYVKLLGNPEWSEVIIEIEACRLTGLEGPKVFFQAKNAEACRYVELGSFGRRGFSVCVQNDSLKERQLVSCPFELEANRWYTLKLVVHKDVVECSIDRIWITSVSLPEPSGGRVGVGVAAGCCCRFRNFTVRRQDGTLLMR